MTYFSQLYKYNKYIAISICTFCVLTIGVNFLKTEITPLFVWGMYSEREKVLNTYDIYRVVVNDSVAIDYSSGFTDANRFFLLSPLSYYIQIGQNGGRDPLEDLIKKKTGEYYDVFNYFEKSIYNDLRRQQAFKIWYANYLEETIHLKVNKVGLEVLRVHYEANGRLKLDSNLKIAL